MRKNRKHSRPQPTLFQPPERTPTWPILPPAVQQKVQALLLQLFRQALAARLASQKKEGCDE